MPSFDGLSRGLGALAAILGTYAASVYWRAGLSLSHYDAKAHLVVARRIFDSLTPSWEQIGAVWLPLPHLINAIPVQNDFFYRTGAFAIAVSIVSFAITTACVSAIVRSLSGSRTGGFLAAALFALNPNVLYLQSTPMTEPLLFALASLVVLHLIEWAKSEVPRARAAVGWIIVAACLTRYEAWPIVGAAIVAAAYVKWRRGLPPIAVVHEAARLTVYPIATVIFFMAMSFASTGQWFVTGGFYVPDPKLQGQPLVVWEAIRTGVEGLAGTRFVQASSIAVVLVALASMRRRWAGLLLTLAPLAAIALPFYAFVSGHPFRIRYEVPLILGGAVAIGAAVSMLRWLAPLAAIPLLIAIQIQVPPFSELAPMTIEAQLDRNNSNGRRAVTDCLKRSYDGTTIMASMGSLAHYMQELSLAGFDLADFMHEGSGPIWQYAYYREPSLFAGWVLVEEAAEGGDMLYQKQKSWPGFLAAYDRVCEGGNVALYRRRGGSSDPPVRRD
ncbi:MAG TPA: hypothetical protein VM096_15485 [Vicinamibacterales bacterium]|nr:hypothetical protein [Vicinamibacterales bacterium]